MLLNLDNIENDYYIRVPGGHGLQNGQKVTLMLSNGAAVYLDSTTGRYIMQLLLMIKPSDCIDIYECQGGTNIITGIPAGAGSYKIQIFSINGRVAAPGLISVFRKVVRLSVELTLDLHQHTRLVIVLTSFLLVVRSILLIEEVIISIVGDTTLALENPVGYAITNKNHYVETTVNVRADGTFLHRPFDGGVEITAGKSPDSTIVRQTRKYFRYQSGKGIQISMAINYNPSRPVLSGTGSGSAITMTTEYPHGLTAGDTVRFRVLKKFPQHTPSSATYDPVTGMFTITQNGHGFEVGEEIFIAEGSITLRCALNSYADDHPYPRSTDPAGGGA